jgi:hypothetical protein
MSQGGHATYPKMECVNKSERRSSLTPPSQSRNCLKFDLQYNNKRDSQRRTGMTYYDPEPNDGVEFLTMTLGGRRLYKDNTIQLLWFGQQPTLNINHFKCETIVALLEFVWNPSMEDVSWKWSGLNVCCLQERG